MTLNKLKDLFIEKYSNGNFDEIPSVKVVMTKQQYIELNDDIIRLSEEMDITIDPSKLYINPDQLLYIEINIPHLCDFIIEIGEVFSLSMVDPDMEFGDEDL